MPMIHVARDGAKLGEFTLEQIREGLGTGQFRSTDLGWQSGMGEWRPLSEFVGAAAVPPAAGAAPAPTLPVVPAGVTAAPAGGGAGLPWENRAQLGFVKAWFDTVSLLITKPTEAFTMMRTEGGLMDPLLFGLIGGCAGAIMTILYQFLFRSFGFANENNLFLSKFGFGVSSFVIVDLILTPVKIGIGLFIFGGILHLCLMLFGGASRSFETTFRVTGYAVGASYLFCLVPMCGGLVALVYLIVLATIGLSRAHQTTTGKALMAVLSPFILCCVVAGVFGLLLGGVIAEYMRHAH
jgi:hypothetical protein